MEIILLLLGEKQSDSEQHGCFSLVLFTPSSTNHPINTPHFLEDGAMDSTRFSFGGFYYIIYKRIGHVITTQPTHYP